MIKTSRKYLNLFPIVLVTVLFAFSTTARAEGSEGTSEDSGKFRTRDNNEFRGRNTPEDEEKRKEAIEKMKENGRERMENRCENNRTMVGNRIEMFRKNERFHKEKYTRIYERLSNLVARLDEQGADTTKLKADLEVLKSKVDILKSSNETLISKLEALKEIDCTDVDARKAAMSEIKTLLGELKTAAEDVREYFINNIKPDLQAIREEVQATKDTDKKEKLNSESETK